MVAVSKKNILERNAITTAAKLPAITTTMTNATTKKKRRRLLANWKQAVMGMVLVLIIVVMWIGNYKASLLSSDHHHHHHPTLDEAFSSSQQRRIPSPFSHRPQDQQEGTNKDNHQLDSDRVPISMLPLTVYLEPPEPLWKQVEVLKPLPRRSITAERLRKVEFPKASSCYTIMQELPMVTVPVTGTEDRSSSTNTKRISIPEADPFLPWIHDVFPSPDNTKIQFVAQNRRRCDTGEDRFDSMKYMEPQISLLQPIPILRTINTNSGKGDDSKFRLAPTMEEATHSETRFICRFHLTTSANNNNATTSKWVQTTLSEYPFNYEYVTWRKKRPTMIETKGKDVTSFWLATLLFSCPVPEEFQPLLQQQQQQRRKLESEKGDKGYDDNWFPAFYIDVIPIRTPARKGHFWLTERHVGPSALKDVSGFNGMAEFGSDHVLPKLDDSGRWENIPICPRREQLSQPPMGNQRQQTPRKESDKKENTMSIPTVDGTSDKPHRLVLCTWTSSSYTRRGDVVRVSDSTQRLLEWIEFHLMVGFDHIYIYDNTDIGDTTGNTNTTEIQDIVARYFGKTDGENADNQQQQEPPRITLHSWPCQVCNNNRPNHPNPGERSSQYAAEASCRERYGPLTDWMAFIDTDEYLVPMTKKDNDVLVSSPSGLDYTWHPLLDEMDDRQIPVLKMVSSRGKPRESLMEILPDQSGCIDPVPPGPRNPNRDKTEPCIGKRANETFLKLYNCDFIRPPKPERFARAMKQIFRPDHVLGHFVHYSTVTVDVAQTFEEFTNQAPTATRKNKTLEYMPHAHGPRWERDYSRELFLDERTQGALVHTKSILPYETRRRSAQCYYESKFGCSLGYVCDDGVKFVDELHKTNGFRNPGNGSFCNCWVNPIVDNILVPELQARMRFRQKARHGLVGR